MGLSASNSGKLCKQLFVSVSCFQPEGGDDNEEIQLELDLPSFDRWIYIPAHQSTESKLSEEGALQSQPILSTFINVPPDIFNVFKQHFKVL